MNSSPHMGDSPVPDPENYYWRVGFKVGRTIYANLHPQDELRWDDDPLIGVMDTPKLAAEAVVAHNNWKAMRDNI